jgi:hypothetical protein
MKNPIGKVDLFHTPENMESLQNWIELHNGADKIHIYTAAMMAWNLASKLVDEAMEEDK